ncbi:hypothetical protein ACLOJK_008176, partial [Asimina triloba]
MILSSFLPLSYDGPLKGLTFRLQLGDQRNSALNCGGSNDESPNTLFLSVVDAY